MQEEHTKNIISVSKCGKIVRENLRGKMLTSNLLKKIFLDHSCGTLVSLHAHIIDIIHVLWIYIKRHAYKKNFYLQKNLWRQHEIRL